MTKKRTLIICVPVYNLKIGKALNSEIDISGTILISAEKIPFVRKRLGFKKKISELDNDYRRWTGKRLFDKDKTYALLPWEMNKGESTIEPMTKIQEAVWILASSQFTTSNRGSVDFFGLPEHDVSYFHSYLIYDSADTGSRMTFSRKSPIQKYHLDSQWKSIMRHHFFPRVLKIINGELHVSSDWRKSIRKAAIFCGKSILSIDISQAFMYNMIALESLLTDRTGKHRKALKERLHALFSWYFDRTPRKWEKIIDHLYDPRNDMVHDGDTSGIKTEDLIYSDIILNNLLLNPKMSDSMSKKVKLA